jgi:hypothetical protein
VRRKSGNSVEFLLTLWVLILFVVLPAINGCALGLGYSTAMFLVHQCSTAATSQRVYEQARDNVRVTSIRLLDSPFAKFVKMVPVGGLNNSGVDLYVDATEVASGRSSVYGPNTPVPKAKVDPATTVYEYRAQGCFEVGPLLSMAPIPFFAYIPGLGTPARIRVSSHRTADYADGVSGEASGSLALVGSGSSTPVTPLKGSSGSSPGPAASDSGALLGDWNYPSIYSAIHNAGQEVVAEDVLQVPAKSAWVSTCINPSGNNQQLWIDLRSDGAWSTNGVPGHSTDADGKLWRVSQDYVTSRGLTGWTFEADGTATKTTGNLQGKLNEDGTPFNIGKLRLNFSPPGTGRLFLQINDDDGNLDENYGVQTVRVVLTQPAS